MACDNRPPGWNKYISERWHLSQYGSQLKDGAQFEPLEGNSKAGLKLDAVMADYRINEALRRLEYVPTSPSLRPVPGTEWSLVRLQPEEDYLTLESPQGSDEGPVWDISPTPSWETKLSPQAHFLLMTKDYKGPKSVSTATIKRRSPKVNAKKTRGRIQKVSCKRKHPMLTRAAARQKSGQSKRLYDLNRPPSMAELNATEN
ncbi:hypothetical protein ABEF93_002611 [Exophiala dermatitidis]